MNGHPGDSELVTITVSDPNLGDVERSFTLHIPAGYSPGNDVETPLVLDFHAFLGIVVVVGRNFIKITSQDYPTVWPF